MQKIEKWRLQQLHQVLERMAGLLSQGGNCEWGNVFKHFHHETQQFVSTGELDFEGLARFISNVKNCFSGLSSFKNLRLYHDDPEKKIRLNRFFFEDRALLYEILEEIESRLKEYIH